MNRKRWRIRCHIVPGLLLLVLLMGVAALALRPDWRYLAADVLTRWSKSAPLEEVSGAELSLSEYTLEEVLTGSNVVEDRSLMLINGDNPLPEDFQPQLAQVEEETELDTAAVAAYQALAQAVEDQFGTELVIRSAYRSRAQQEETIEEDGGVAAGLDASEHQAGLALDLAVPGYGGRSLLKTAAGQYLNDSCWQYGFIVRYPYYGEGETGIPYEPWHLRYVGTPHAQLMMENSWTLEEYSRRLQTGSFYRFGSVLITRQSGDTFQLPQSWEQLTLSPDNQGGWVFTITLQ